MLLRKNNPVKGSRYITGLKKAAACALIVLLWAGSFKTAGFALPAFLLDTAYNAYSQEPKEPRELRLLKEGIYWVTDLKIGEPMTFLTAAFPGGSSQEPIKGQLAEVKGYFEQDENSYVTQEEIEREEQILASASPAGPEEGALQLPDLSNLKDVYTHYFSASGKMDFGLDMLEEWDFNELAAKKLKLDKSQEGPQILIFHTHAREDYVGGQTVVDVGEALKKELEEKYGIEVLHVTDEFYEPDNPTKYVTRTEYERMEPVIEKVLKENPSISGVLDIHRDGVDQDVHLVTEVEGRPTAKIMFVNGLCMNRNLEGKIEKKEGLPNPYLEDNLAFSLQSNITMNTLYPGLSRKIYLNEWRYSTHMCPQSLLVEWGANTNTGEEAMNAVAPMARVFMTVLGEDEKKH